MEVSFHDTRFFAWKTYEEAEEKAKQVLKQLPKGWNLKVFPRRFENSTRFSWLVAKGDLTLHPFETITEQKQFYYGAIANTAEGLIHYEKLRGGG